MYKLFIGITIQIVIVVSQCAIAERMQLQKPEYDTDLGDTSQDIQVKAADGSGYIGSDSHAEARFDASTGTYYFRFKSDDGNTYEAYWLPNSNIDATISANVKVFDEGLLGYTYEIMVLSTSVRQLQRVTIEILSDVAPGQPSDEGWNGRVLTRDNRRLWTWTIGLEEAPVQKVQKSTELSIKSKGLPSLVPCWIRGDGNDLYSEQWPVESVGKFHSSRQGILVDAARGVTVAPGGRKVDLPMLRTYFDTSIQQGWLEDGAYRDELRVLLDDAMRDHERAERGGVLLSLHKLLRKVESVYAQKDSPILSEAYALLHFNCKYLLDHYGKEESESRE